MSGWVLSPLDNFKNMSSLMEQRLRLIEAVLSLSHLLDDALAHPQCLGDFRLCFKEIAAIRHSGKSLSGRSEVLVLQ